MRIDHLVVVAERLEDGVSLVEERLGATFAPGGRHAEMGTHNRLLSLGDGRYLEVIAPDPDADAPSRPRWFGLDRHKGPPRLAHWVAACDDLRATLAEAPLGMGEVGRYERGDLRWSMAVPADGMLPGDGVLPGLLQWTGRARAADMLPASPFRLQRITLVHPEAERLRADWPAFAALDGIVLETGGTPRIEAGIVTPRGLRILSSAFATQ